MKTVIVCLNSKYIHASLAPWYLVAGVRDFSRADNVVTVYESTVNADMDKVAGEIADLAPETVAFCSYIWNITQVLYLAKKIKAALGCNIVVGGPEVGYRARDVLTRYPFIDYVLTGEGERSFPLLLDAVCGIGEFSQVAGLSFRGKGEIVSVPECEGEGMPPDPYCDEFFENLNGRICYIESSRGCPYRCAFCLSGRCGKLRFFEMDSVKRNILRLANSGTQTVKFVDRTFNANAEHANEILSFIKDNYGGKVPRGVTFHFEIAGDILKESTLKILESMPKGAVQLEIGMQSFNEKTLDAINRKTDTARLITNIRRLIGFDNMHIHIDLIAGLTGEDFESFGRSFDTGYALGAHMLQMGFLKLLHGADMREDPDRYPCEFSENPPYEVTHTPWLSKSEIKTLKACEDALERLYNSGRFRFTLSYLTERISPFKLFCDIGENVSGERLSLTDYADAVYRYLSTRFEGEVLREKMACDMITTVSPTQLPKSLKRFDKLYSDVCKRFDKGTKIVILYSKGEVFAVEKDAPRDLYGRQSGKIYKL